LETSKTLPELFPTDSAGLNNITKINASMNFQKLGSLYLIIVFLLITGCSSSPERIVIFTDRDEHVWLQYQVEKKAGVEIPVPQGFDHPFEISVGQMEGLLRDVYRQEYDIFKWQEADSVFTENELKKLSPILVEAFQKATVDQWVHFAVMGQRPGLILKHFIFTDGICYVKEGRFNIVFSNIAIRWGDEREEIYTGDPRELFRFPFVRLVPNPEKGIDLPPIIQGNEWLNKEHGNWLMIDVKSANNRFLLAEESKASEGKSQKTPASRLQMLKELIDKELISKEEYEKKRKEILEQL